MVMFHQSEINNSSPMLHDVSLNDILPLICLDVLGLTLTFQNDSVLYNKAVRSVMCNE